MRNNGENIYIFRVCYGYESWRHSNTLAVVFSSSSSCGLNVFQILKTRLKNGDYVEKEEVMVNIERFIYIVKYALRYMSSASSDIAYPNIFMDFFFNRLSPRSHRRITL